MPRQCDPRRFPLRICHAWVETADLLLGASGQLHVRNALVVLVVVLPDTASLLRPDLPHLLLYAPILPNRGAWNGTHRGVVRSACYGRVIKGWSKR